MATVGAHNSKQTSPVCFVGRWHDYDKKRFSDRKSIQYTFETGPLVAKVPLYGRELSRESAKPAPGRAGRIPI